MALESAFAGDVRPAPLACRPKERRPRRARRAPVSAGSRFARTGIPPTRFSLPLGDAASINEQKTDQASSG